MSMVEESARDLGRVYTRTQEYSTFLLLKIPFLTFEWLYLNIPSSSLWFIHPVNGPVIIMRNGKIRPSKRGSHPSFIPRHTLAPTISQALLTSIGTQEVSSLERP